MNIPVMYVLDNFPGPTAGTESQFWLLYQLMCTHGNVAPVFTLRKSEFFAEKIPDRYECLGIGSLASPTSLAKSFRFAYRARSRGIRIAHLFLNDTSVLLPFFLWLFGIKTIISRRDLGFWYTRPILKLLRINRYFVSAAVANCNAVAEVTQEQERYDASKTPVILNGVKKPDSIEPMNLKERFNIGQHTVLLGMLANLRPLKGIRDAILSIATLKILGVNAHLVVAGADVLVNGVSEQKRLEQYALELGVHEQVSFLGPITSTWPFLAELDIFLSCSSSEGLSNSIMEAMASGTPVVATRVGGTPSIIEHDKSGLLYEPGQLNDLVTCIMSYIKNPQWTAHIAEEAKAFAETYLSPEALLNAHQCLYSRILGIKPDYHTHPTESVVLD